MPIRLRAARAVTRCAALVCALCAAVPSAVRAENDFAVFGGWRASGTLQDSVAQRDVRLRDRGAISAALDLTLDATRQIEIFVSQQQTSMQVTPVGSSGAITLPVKINYVHFGGTNYFDGPAGVGPYVAGGLGFTRLAPGLDGFDSATKASLSLALGYSLPLARYVALRVEGRGYWTLVNSSGNLFCSGGCTISIKGDTLQQIEMLAGISARF
jgi:hypothetical protein